MSLINIFSLGLIKSATFTVSHENIRERFGIPSAYLPIKHFPTLFMYNEFGINYGATREDIVRETGAQSLADEWYRDLLPKRFNRRFPAIDNREGILATNPSMIGEGAGVPQAIYNYYQSGSTPKFGVMIVDDTDIGATLSIFDERTYEVAKPVRFAMFAKQDLDEPMGGELTILNIYVDGKKIKLSEESINNALRYADKLFDQIKSGAYNPVEAYGRVYGVPAVADKRLEI